MAAPPWNPDHPLLGRLLQNRYQIASFIREGGMAQVFCAVQDQEPRHVAIKVMHPELSEDPEIVARFIREARTASRLRHPNIVDILSISEDRELLFIAMELLFGDDLSARVKLKGSFTEERSAEIIVDLCEALHFAHGQGVIHRDIKPENVMLARQPNAPEKEVVKVLDFGIAKILDERPDVELPMEAPTGVRSVLTRVGTWVGTPAYMSPEQGSVANIDHRTDIYSAGVLLFELVCGRTPFEGQTPLQILAMHIHEAPPKPSSITKVNPGLEAVILRALEKDPNRRYESARAMGDALLNVIPDLAIASSQRWVGRTHHGAPLGPPEIPVSPTLSSAPSGPAPARPRGWVAPRPSSGPMNASPPPASVANKNGGVQSERHNTGVTMPSARDGVGARQSQPPPSNGPSSDASQSLRGLKQTMMLRFDPSAPSAATSGGTAEPQGRPAHPLIGRMLAERYHVASFIREGSMAQVFCGLQDEEPRHVAIKVVHPELADDPGIVARFLQEGQLAARLRHPNIVRIVDVGEDNELLYMVMELLFGDDLSARIKQRGSVDAPRAIQIVIDTLRALEHAHSNGIVHRDVKPENIMLCRMPDSPEKEIVKVLDFGIAKVLDAKNDVSLPMESPTAVRSVLTRVGSLVGTPAYMSPEQGRAEPVDHRSDIYSVGVLLYELLCGKPPFEGETPLQIVARHVHQPPVPPSTLVPMSPDLEALILRALAKDPAARPQSARELADALLAVGTEGRKITGQGAASDRWIRHTGRGFALSPATSSDNARAGRSSSTGITVARPSNRGDGPVTQASADRKPPPAERSATQTPITTHAMPGLAPPSRQAPETVQSAQAAPPSQQQALQSQAAQQQAAQQQAMLQQQMLHQAQHAQQSQPQSQQSRLLPSQLTPARSIHRTERLPEGGVAAALAARNPTPPPGYLPAVNQPLQAPQQSPPQSAGDPRVERLVRLVAVLVVLLGIAFAVILVFVIRSVH